ncbi:unnamed protein product, partial [Heterosigma akashiwo]
KIEVTPELVKKTAGLATVEITDEEVQRLTPRINDFLGFVEKLNEVDTSGASQMLRVRPAGQVARPDVPAPAPAAAVDAALDNFPEEEDAYLVVPKVGAEES